MKAQPVRRWTVRVLGLLAFLALIGLGVSWGLNAGMDLLLTKPGPVPSPGAETVVELERGLGVSAIGKRLEDARVISNDLIFRIGVWRYGATRDLRAGEYAIPPGASMREIIALLRSGTVRLHRLTIPEGLTTKQILRLVEAENVLQGPMPALPPEGSLLPDTYFFPKGETRKAVLDRMAKAQADFMVENWPKRDQGLPITTPEQALILASIVEKETGLAAERPRVAAVFINRLKKGMRLQADSTIIYAVTGGDPIGRAIKRSEIDARTPYNTYQVDGLPPTPIANPGRASILAVLNAPLTKELYFVADGTGGHIFAETAAEHQRNHAKWRQIRRQQSTADPG